MDTVRAGPSQHAAQTGSPHVDRASAAHTDVLAPSHPITAGRIRIQRENTLIGRLHDALDANDAANIRELLTQYRQEFPEDIHLMGSGFEIIAACLERLDPATRASARDYYDRQRASTLRRYIRRHCLEPS